MLRELSVQNLAVIEDVRVELQPGFCAWTGETGAGKTLLLEALSLLFGARGSADLLRKDADEMRVVGRFEIAQPQRLAALEEIVGGPFEDGQLILMRRLTRNGRSLAYVNDRPTTLTTLRSLGDYLIDIHGQHESRSLLQASYQLELLDAYGDLERERATYIEVAEALRQLRRRRNDLIARRQQRLRDLALVRFEREELDTANLTAGELNNLGQERERLSHTQALRQFATDACGRLYEQEGAFSETLGRLAREAQHWAAVDPQLASIATRLESLGNETQDLAQTLAGLAESWQADPQRLDHVELRMQQLRRLEAKYARPIEELIDYRIHLDTQEVALQKEEDDLEKVDSELATAFERLQQAGNDLSKKRQRVARRFSQQVQRELADLGMPEAKLHAALVPIDIGTDPATAEAPGSGLDQLELMLSANPGEEARPLRKVASGGELSRTMLAIKTVLAAHDQVGTLIFDEIDANIGGRLGDVLGAKLAALGKTHQVICVTHLPQVACFARRQWSIRKVRQGKRTTSRIELLADTDRLEELASMLRGEARGETTRKEAAAMLDAAKNAW